MSIIVRRNFKPLFLLFLVVLVATSAAVSAQTSTNVSTARVDFGTLGRGQSAQRDVILISLVNNSTVTYSITFSNVTNVSGELTATPSRGVIGPKTNITVSVRLDVSKDATEGNYSSSMVINESTAPAVGGGNSTARPTVVLQAIYTIQGNAPAYAELSGVDVPLVAGVLGVSTLVAIAALYVILKRT
jgi:hypothetical protein